VSLVPLDGQVQGLSKGIFDAVDIELVAAVYRSHAGKVLGDALRVKELYTPIFTLRKMS
jgi:hypothetical protein